jgi:hypothetical protein
MEAGWRRTGEGGVARGARAPLAAISESPVHRCPRDDAGLRTRRVGEEAGRKAREAGRICAREALGGCRRRRLALMTGNAVANPRFPPRRAARAGQQRPLRRPARDPRAGGRRTGNLLSRHLLRTVRRSWRSRRGPRGAGRRAGRPLARDGRGGAAGSPATRSRASGGAFVVAARPVPLRAGPLRRGCWLLPKRISTERMLSMCGGTGG